MQVSLIRAAHILLGLKLCLSTVAPANPFQPDHFQSNPFQPGLASKSELSLALRLSYATPEKRYRIQGELEFKLPAPDTVQCFYLPFNDRAPVKHYEPLRHFQGYISAPESEAEAFAEAKVLAQQTLVTGLTPSSFRYEQLSPFVILVRGPSSQASAKLKFVSSLKAPANQDQLFAGFHPIPLRHCPTPALARDSNAVRSLQIKSKLRATVLEDRAFWSQGPSGLQIIGPGLFSVQKTPFAPRQFAQGLSVYAEQLVFLAGTGFSYEALEVAGVTIELFMRQPLSAALRRTIRAAFLSHTKWFGRFPYDSLTIVESTLLHKADLPGLIVINQPRQYFFNALQENYLNWKHWVLANLVAAQWFGGAIAVADDKDSWFLAGMCDFATLMFLQSQANRFNLFNHYDGDFNLISLNYAQIQDLTASFLFRDKPLAALTDQNLQSLKTSADQSPLLFIKHALALRYLRFAMGSDKFYDFVRLFTQRHLFKSLKPKAFHNALLSYPYQTKSASQTQSASKQKMADYLRSLWTQKGWPDYTLAAFRKKKLASGKWLAEATVSLASPSNLPTQLQFADRSGKNYLLTSEPPLASNQGSPLSQKTQAAQKGQSWKVWALTDSEPVDVTIDPFHHHFDSDRFDNQASSPGVNVFPLGTNTLSDRAYTSLWFPYIFRRPGEGASIAVQTALLKYLRSGFFAKIELAPSSRQLAYHGRWEWGQPELATMTQFSLTRSYNSFHTAEAQRSKKLSDHHNVSARAALRYRFALGQAKTRHSTLAAGLVAGEQKLLVPCVWSGSADIEYAPPLEADRYHYSRQAAILSLACSSAKRVRYSLRHFRGFLRSWSLEIPPMASFRVNQLDEAGVRLDEESMRPLSHLASFNQDLFLPMGLSFGESSMLLTQKLQLRLFYDLGFTSWQDLRAYESAGLGIVLPLGGDVVGLGPLTLSRFSFSTILYSKKEGEISLRPRFLFDLSGEL